MWRNLEPLFTVGGNVKWGSCCREQLDSSPKIKTVKYYIIIPIFCNSPFLSTDSACAITEGTLILQPESEIWFLELLCINQEQDS